MRDFYMVLLLAFLAFGVLILIGAPGRAMVKGNDLMDTKPEGYPVAIFGGGCFWCLESEYRALNGVLFTRVGYMGGDLENPSYQDVTTGKSGHAEVVEVTFDPAKTSYRDLVEFFLTKAHDPTTLDRQGVDVGPQYRSEIFYTDNEQKKIAEELIEYVNMNKVHTNPIVTKLAEASTFWEGEDYHQQYYEKYEVANGAPHIRVQMKKGKKR